MDGKYPESKQEYVKRILGKLYDEIERVYYEVVLTMKTFGELEANPRIQTQKDREYSKEHYNEIYKTLVRLEGFVIDVKSQLQSKLALP